MAPQQGNRLLEPYRKRMYNLSIFFKELKGRFAQWFNRRRRRYGVLWAERFKSLLLEGGRAVATVAAYIDLNPVRAALCADPKEYRYCGYAEALAKGSAAAYEKIRTILGLPETTPWEELLTEYRKHLFMRGALATNQHGPAFELAKAQEVVEQEKGELSLQEQLRCRIRYFSDGVILGSRSFVESHCQRLRQKVRLQAQEWPDRPKDPRPSGAVGLPQSASADLRLIDFSAPAYLADSNQPRPRTAPSCSNGFRSLGSRTPLARAPIRHPGPAVHVVLHLNLELSPSHSLGGYVYFFARE